MLKYLAVLPMLLLLTACGNTFDPNEARPCEFFDEDTLANEGIQATKLEPNNGSTGCHYTRTSGWSSSFQYMKIFYTNEPLDEVVEQIGVLPTAEAGNFITHAAPDLKNRSKCMLVGPRDNNKTIIIYIGINKYSTTSGKTSCDYVFETIDFISERLGI